VRYKGVTGSYMPFLLTSTDDALLVGREVFGMPKLLCDDGRVWIDGNARRASLVRRGDEILNLSVNLEKRVEGEKLLPVHRFFLKKIASPDPEWPSLAAGRVSAVDGPQSEMCVYGTRLGESERQHGNRSHFDRAHRCRRSGLRGGKLGCAGVESSA
jgi:hypothetical protein